jgi:trimeric autotransporter adhesin
MKNIYDGVAVLDAQGEAVVQLPDWFESLNRDFRYLLTAIGAPAPTLYIATKINKNHFKIAGGQPGLEVSWQVTGIRQDSWANKHRIPVEEQKPEVERGYYLHPDAFNQPEDKRVEWARRPELIKQLKKQKPQ